MNSKNITPFLSAALWVMTEAQLNKNRKEKKYRI